MSNFVKLRKAATYCSDRIEIDSVTLDNYVTTDNLLQNKLGLSRAIGLPPQQGMLPAYSAQNILVANIRPYLKKIWFADKYGGCSADVLVFSVKDEFDSKFIYYAMFRDDFFSHVMKGSKGTKMPRGDKTQILDFTVPLFEKLKQQKIASVLSALDAKIKLNNRINTELESMAKTLYDYWFVQFDFPDENGKPYKSSGGNMVYNEILKREIPEGWESKKLGEVLKTSLGGTPSTKDSTYWDEAGISWLNSGEIANFPIIESEESVTQKGIDNSAAELLPKGSVVISIVRHIRTSILAINAATNQSVVGIYESSKLKNSYIYPLLSNDVPRLMSLRTGAQQPHINKGEVDSIPVLIPDKELMKQYYCIVDPIYKKLMLKAFENQQLTQLRDWLLPMLMNGQVTVKYG